MLPPRASGESPAHTPTPHPSASARRRSAPRVPRRPLAELLRQRSWEDGLTSAWRLPLKSPAAHPWLYRKRLGSFPTQAAPGDWVKLMWNGEVWGWGLFNPHAEIAVRLIRLGSAPPDLTWCQQRLQAAVALRRSWLKLDEVSTAYRVLHAEADDFSGLVVEKLGEVLVAEAFSLAMYQRAWALLEWLAPLCDTTHTMLIPGPQSDLHEGFHAEPVASLACPPRVEIREHGTRFRLDFTTGQKTGFYCDQRDNRYRLAQLSAGRTLLDVCCYTGGFALQALRLGAARRAVGVDLDEQAIHLARLNAKLNHLPQAQFVHADAFSYLRDAQKHRQAFDIVVLDPPKLIRQREELGTGKRKYYDLNKLALQVVSSGGMLLTCSCSGLLERNEFVKLVQAAAHDVGRSLTLLAQSGAAPDHPVSTRCPESEYLKTLWWRVE
ncbi:MAG: oxidoreductase [Planctomycetaceae bacterium]|nr:MAG: oxidoreductase [Planctomycetaceae bacterium]